MLSDLQKRKLPRLFATYDADGNGRIDLLDFDRLLHQFAAFRGWTPGMAPYEDLRARLVHRWERMQRYADRNSDGSVTLSEWMAYMEAVLEDDAAYEAELAGVAGAVFGVFDLDADDALTTEELRALYRGLGLGPAHIKELYERLGMGTGDRMTKERFLDLLDDFLTSPDPDEPGNWLFGG